MAGKGGESFHLLRKTSAPSAGAGEQCILDRLYDARLCDGRAGGDEVYCRTGAIARPERGKGADAFRASFPFYGKTFSEQGGAARCRALLWFIYRISDEAR